MADPQPRTIGLLTSGGDCAGLNAVMRAVVHRAIGTYGWNVQGIMDGTMGLMERPLRVRALTMEDFDGTVFRQAGTILGTTNKGNPFRYPMEDGSFKDLSDVFVEGYKELGLSGLICIGGDGSMRIISDLCDKGGIPFIGIPKTIDNDVPLTEFSVGFDTAVNTAVDTLDKLQPTAASHHRVMILEVMGRDAGHIAMRAGLAGGADVILIPEIPYRIEDVAAKLERLRASGRNHALIVCSEAIKTPEGDVVVRDDEEGKKRYGGVGHVLGEQVEKATDAEVRVTVLGHAQRGGSPTGTDRVVASAFGVRAVDLMAQGMSGRMVAWQDGGVVDVDLDVVTSLTNPVNIYGTLVATARGLGTYVGDLDAVT